jgi:uncharacterized protein
MKKVLSIDAGGTRGIIPAIILAEIEARASQPVSNLFDFFAGTSTGGMLVLGLNRPDPGDCLRPLCSATEVGWLFHEWGNRAFGDKLSKTDRLVSARSPGDRIEEMFREYFGNTRLSHSLRPTMVTAFDLVLGRPFFFNSVQAARNNSADIFMWQAARATTAVATHFAPLRLSVPRAPLLHDREVCLIDGSLFAANPAACALAEARVLFPEEDDFLLISLGCGEVNAGSPPLDLQKMRRRIVDCSLTAQSACVDYQMRAFLPVQRYIRIQAELKRGFDRIDDTSRDYLLTMDRVARETIVRYSKVLDYVVDLVSPDPVEHLDFDAA